MKRFLLGCFILMLMNNVFAYPVILKSDNPKIIVYTETLIKNGKNGKNLPGSYSSKATFDFKYSSTNSSRLVLMVFKVQCEKGFGSVLVNPYIREDDDDHVYGYSVKGGTDFVLNDDGSNRFSVVARYLCSHF